MENLTLMDVIGFDWFLYYFPAIKAFLAGQNPYTSLDVVVSYSPWTLLILSPLGFLPAMWGYVIVGIINITGLLAFLRKQNCKLWQALPIAFSFPFISLILWGNLDGMSLWGLAIGGPLGLILLSVKPQAAFLVSLVWVKQAWDQGKFPAVVRLVAPFILLVGVTLYFYPEWIQRIIFTGGHARGLLANGYPWFIPLGLALLVAALRNNREDSAVLGTVLVSPYVRIQSWVATLTFLIVKFPLEGTVAAISTWFVFLALYLN